MAGCWSSTLYLSDLAKGEHAIVTGISADGDIGASLPMHELERRLLEMGFVEGAQLQVLHEGLVGRDPIVVKLDDMRIALRRREARTVCIAPVRDDPGAGS
jgi:ferrous iron transport protein A